jgi:hypothetical protein
MGSDCEADMVFCSFDTFRRQLEGPTPEQGQSEIPQRDCHKHLRHPARRFERGKQY